MDKAHCTVNQISVICGGKVGQFEYRLTRLFDSIFPKVLEISSSQRTPIITEDKRYPVLEWTAKSQKLDQ